MKCKYFYECSIADKESRTCMEDGGLYYNGNRYAGCYMLKEESKKSSHKTDYPN